MAHSLSVKTEPFSIPNWPENCTRKGGTYPWMHRKLRGVTPPPPPPLVSNLSFGTFGSEMLVMNTNQVIR